MSSVSAYAIAKAKEKNIRPEQEGVKISTKRRIALAVITNTIKTLAHAVLILLGFFLYCVTLGHYQNKSWAHTRTHARLTAQSLKAFFHFQPKVALQVPVVSKETIEFQDILNLLKNDDGKRNADRILEGIEKDVSRYQEACRKGRGVPPRPSLNYVYLPQDLIESCLNALVADETMQWFERRADKKTTFRAIIAFSHCCNLDYIYNCRIKFVESCLVSGNLSFLREMGQCMAYREVGCFGPLNPHLAFEEMDERLKKVWEECPNEKVRQEAMLYFSAPCFANNANLLAAIIEYAQKPSTHACCPLICEKVLNPNKPTRSNLLSYYL